METPPADVTIVKGMGAVFPMARCADARRPAVRSKRPLYSQDGQGGSMMTIRKEVRELISANEKIHSAIAHGERLTDGEKRLVEICASELIASMSKKQKRRFGYQHSRLV